MVVMSYIHCPTVDLCPSLRQNAKNVDSHRATKCIYAQLNGEPKIVNHFCGPSGVMGTRVRRYVGHIQYLSCLQGPKFLIWKLASYLKSSALAHPVLTQIFKVSLLPPPLIRRCVIVVQQTTDHVVRRWCSAANTSGGLGMHISDVSWSTLLLRSHITNIFIDKRNFHTIDKDLLPTMVSINL